MSRLYAYDKGQIKYLVEPEKSMIEMACEILTWKMVISIYCISSYKCYFYRIQCLCGWRG